MSETVYTITLSGPQETAEQARRRLVEAGVAVLADDSGRGLPREPGEAFINVKHEDANVPGTIVESLGWRFRMSLQPGWPALPLEQMISLAAYEGSVN